MGPKYEFTDKTMNHNGHLLHKIRFLEDGKLGGWIESEDNLNQVGNCRVLGRAKVYGNACVIGNAQVFRGAEVYDNAIISGNSRVYSEAKVFNNAYIKDNAKVSQSSLIYHNAIISGHANIHDNSSVSNNAHVAGYAEVFNNSTIFDNAQIYGDTELSLTSVFGDTILKTGKYYKQSICEYTNYKNISINVVNNNILEIEQMLKDWLMYVRNSGNLYLRSNCNNIREFVNNNTFSSYDNNDYITIVTGIINIPIIKIEKFLDGDEPLFKYTSDITDYVNNDSSHIIKIIDSIKILSEALDETIAMLEKYPQFSRYMNDLYSLTLCG